MSVTLSWLKKNVNKIMKLFNHWEITYDLYCSIGIIQFKLTRL